MKMKMIIPLQTTIITTPIQQIIAMMIIMNKKIIMSIMDKMHHPQIPHWQQTHHRPQQIIKIIIMNNNKLIQQQIQHQIQHQIPHWQ